MSVYFITCRHNCTVKIGCSLEPHHRLKELQVSNPYPLVVEAMMPGNYTEENEMQARFSDCRLHGEWFAITPEIEALMAANPASAPPAKPAPAAVTKPHVGMTRQERWAAEDAEFDARVRRRAEQRLARMEHDGDIHFPFRAEVSS